MDLSGDRAFLGLMEEAFLGDCGFMGFLGFLGFMECHLSFQFLTRSVNPVIIYPPSFRI